MLRRSDYFNDVMIDYTDTISDCLSIPIQTCLCTTVYIIRYCKFSYSQEEYNFVYVYQFNLGKVREML